MSAVLVTAGFRPRPESVREARAWADRVCRAAGVVACLDEVRLVVSELVTNAVVHAGTTLHLELDVEPDGAGGGRVRVSVLDRREELPVLRSASLEDEGGRGLRMVSRLGRLRHELRAEGKVVQVDLEAAGSAARAGEDELANA